MKKYLIYLLVPILLLSCSNTDSTGNSSEELSDVPLQLKLVTRADANAIGKDQVLEKLRLLIYKEDGHLEANLLFAGDELKKTIPNSTEEAGVYYIDATLTLTYGRKTFCLVGNETTTLTSTFSTNSNINKLSDLDGLRWVVTPQKGELLPFTCRESHTLIVGTNNVSFNLLRAVARVDLRLWKSADLTTSNIVLNSLTILNEAKQSRLMNGNPLSKADAQFVTSGQTKTFSTAHPVAVVPDSPADQDDKTEIIHSFYLFEFNPAVESDITSLKLDYTQDGKKESFTAKLAGGKNADDSYIYRIKRNTLTDLRLTFEGDGDLKVNCAVVDWSDGAGGNIIFDGQYYLSIKPKKIFNFSKNTDTDVVRVKTDVPAGFKITKITESDGVTENTGWLSTDKIIGTSYGTGEVETTVNIYVDENNDGMARTGYIYIKAGRVEAKLTVTQGITAKKPIFNFITYINVDGSDQTVPATGGKIQAVVNTNMGWTFRADNGDEISAPEPASDIAENSILSIDLPLNASWTSKDTKVWVEYKDLELQKTTFTQPPGYNIINASVTPNTLAAHQATTVTFRVMGTYSANSVKVRVLNNETKAVLVSEAYITTAQTASEGTQTRSVPANPSWDSRPLAMQYYHPGTNEWKTIKIITQKGYEVTQTSATPVTGILGGNSSVALTGYRPLLFVRAVIADGSPVNGTVSAGSTPTTKTTIDLAIPANRTMKDRLITIQWSKDNSSWTNITSFTQKASIALRFARSNVIWNGSKLTFATTAAENASIPSNYQGVFFRWGSLVAISPVPTSGTSTASASGYIVYSSTGNKNYTWQNIPYTNDNVAPFNDGSEASDDFATYNGSTGYNATTGKGDICRLISKNGWVSGKWRLPTAKELEQLIDEKTSIANGSFASQPNVPNNAANTQGRYQFPSGRWLGIFATTGGSVTSPVDCVYFPATGYQYLSEDNPPLTNTHGYGYWGFYNSGSSADVGNRRYIEIRSTGAVNNSVKKTFSFPVRCIRILD